MVESGLLERFAATLKGEIGPAVDGEYPRTQAFLGAVVLQKLSAELRLAPAHAEAAARDRAELRRDLGQMLDDAAMSPELRSAFDAIGGEGDDGLCRFIERLYDERERLGEERFNALRGRVRQGLRRSIDRRMEVAS